MKGGKSTPGEQKKNQPSSDKDSGFNLVSCYSWLSQKQPKKIFYILMSLKDSTVGYKLRERLYISVLKLFRLGSHRACVMNMTRQLDLLCGRQ